MWCRVPATILNAWVWHPKKWMCSGENEPSQPLRCVKVKEMPRRWGGTDGRERERELRVWAITLLFRTPSFLALLEPLLAWKHWLTCPLKCHGCWQRSHSLPSISFWKLPTLLWMCSGGKKHTKSAGKWRALQASVCTDRDLATLPAPTWSKERSCGLWTSSWGMHSSCPLFQNTLN